MVLAVLRSLCETYSMILPTINPNPRRVKLPLDCEADYFPDLLTRRESEEIFDYLCQHYDLSPDTIRMADGSLFENDRGKYIFADPELTSFEHLPELLGRRSEWPPLLAMLKDRLESVADPQHRAGPAP